MRTYLQNFFNTRLPGNVQRMLLKNFFLSHLDCASTLHRDSLFYLDRYTINCSCILRHFINIIFVAVLSLHYSLIVARHPWIVWRMLTPLS